MIINTEKQRFELITDGHLSYATFEENLEDKKLIIKYVESAVELRGKGVAGKLMSEILSYANEKELQIIPICGYAASWLRRNKYQFKHKQ